MSDMRDGPRGCAEFVRRGGALLVPASPESLARTVDLMQQYRYVPMDYAAAGLAKYWLADSENGTIEIRRLGQRLPLTIAVFTSSDSLTSPLLPGFALPVGPIFAR